MANTLLDAINQNRQSLGQPAPASTTDETGQIATLLRAKSGRATAGAPVAAQSNLGEQATNAATGQELQGIQQQALLQAQSDTVRDAATAQDARIARENISQAGRFQTLENRMRTNSLLSELERDRSSLSLDKDRARLEQAATLLSLQDKQYTDQLQDIGRRRRLDSDLAFREEMQGLVFGNQLQLLQERLGIQDVMRENDRTFRKKLSDMGIDDAIAVAEIERQTMLDMAALEREGMAYGMDQTAKQQQIAQQAQGQQQIISGAAQGYAAYKNSNTNSNSAAIRPSDSGYIGDSNSGNYGNYA